MKKIDNQRGAIGPIELVLIIAILAIIGFVGYRIYQTNGGEEIADNTSSSEPISTPDNGDANSEDGDQEEAQSLEIIELDDPIELSSVEDIDLLPENTVGSFKQYMNGLLSSNAPSDKGCVKVYTVNKLSDVNVLGGIETVESETLERSDNCGGASGIVWYSNSDGLWDGIGKQAIPECADIGSYVYSEFLDVCVDENQNNIDNPNGSITNI